MAEGAEAPFLGAVVGGDVLAAPHYVGGVEGMAYADDVERKGVAFLQLDVFRCLDAESARGEAEQKTLLAVVPGKGEAVACGYAVGGDEGVFKKSGVIGGVARKAGDEALVVKEPVVSSQFVEGAPGGLVVVVHVAPEPFERRGAELHFDGLLDLQRRLVEFRRSGGHETKGLVG